MKFKLFLFVIIILMIVVVYADHAYAFADENYIIVDTGQVKCYSDVDSETVDCPEDGEDFYGQDSTYNDEIPNYTLSGDGLTVYDNVTGLNWTKSPDFDGDGDIDTYDKMTFAEAQAYPDDLDAINFGGYNDWRLPTIKELYSLIVFSGIDPSAYSGSGTSGLTPFIDTDFFDYNYGDTSAGERIIDAQYWSATEYVSTTMNGDHTVFGVNFADGRIKGYGTIQPGPAGGADKTQYVRFVRGNPGYGVNDFVDNGDGTVTDLATGLMWQQSDSGSGLNFQDSLAYAESLDLAGHTDWRVPNAKELQGILDYTRSPDTTASAAIDPVFGVTGITNEGGAADFPFYWSSTTHVGGIPDPSGGIPEPTGKWGAYIAFGRALGFMQPPGGGAYNLLDVHGAGSQRSDPKIGSASSYPNGHGPQGDVVRVDNFVRCVRGTSSRLCQPLTANGDTNCDCKINMKDLAHFAAQWNKTACGKCKGKDLTGEGNVNTEDLAIIAAIWLQGK